ncbi:hypothetical protein ONZ45_g4479 [Pleurotus djamor]|nr:hypothetical protein ONZ45_g4479 [Pleurotus djamor]
MVNLTPPRDPSSLVSSRFILKISHRRLFTGDTSLSVAADNLHHPLFPNVSASPGSFMMHVHYTLLNLISNSICACRSAVRDHRPPIVSSTVNISRFASGSRDGADYLDATHARKLRRFGTVPSIAPSCHVL